MSSLVTADALILFVGCDDDYSTRVADAIRPTETTVVSVSTARALGDRLEAETVACVVVGDALEDVSVESLLTAIVADHPTVPVVRFASTGGVRGADATDGDDDRLAARIDASSAGAIEHLAARLEAICTRQRVDALEGSFSAIADSATDGVARLDSEGRITDVSDGFAETLECDPDDILGIPITSLYDSDADSDSDSDSDPRFPTDVLAGDTDRWTGLLVGRTPAGEPVEREHEVRRTAPDHITWLLHPEPGPSLRTEALTSHSILESVLESLPLSLYVKNEDARHIRASQDQVDPPIEAPDGTLLTDPAQFIGKTDHDLFASNLSDKSYHDDRQVIETGEPVIETVERYDVRPDEKRWTMTSKVPWTDHEGTIRGLVGVTTDITTEIKHERESERQRERLESFASMVAHDLRNPLNVARGYVELAQKTGSIESLEDADYSLDRMERLIDDVLLLDREGESVLEPSSVCLHSLTEATWDQIPTDGASLSVEDDVRIQADRNRLAQLLENLLKNAVQHGSPTAQTGTDSDTAADHGDEVTVTVRALEESANDGESGFSIEDNGPGIPADERESIFESGYTTASEGTGFGLSIVEQIADAHGWSVSVTEGDAGGARFEIRGVELGQ